MPNRMQLVNSSNLDESQRAHGKSGLLSVLMLRIGKQQKEAECELLEPRRWFIKKEKRRLLFLLSSLSHCVQTKNVHISQQSGRGEPIMLIFACLIHGSN